MSRYGTIFTGDGTVNWGNNASQLIDGRGAVTVDYQDGQINIHGQLVGGGAPPPGPLDQLLGFVKANPLLCVGGAVGLFLVARRK